jgi:glycosyltransferase involved in cell wall biosynthesis
MSSDPRLVLVAPLSDPSGHADEARSFLRVLEHAGREPVARELRWTDVSARVSGEDRRMLDRQRARAMPREGVALHGYMPHAGQAELDGLVNVARAMFETDRLPAAWLAPLLERDEVWVPSAHNADVFRCGGLPASRIRVVGGTLDLGAFRPDATPVDLRVMARVPEGHRIVLTNFDIQERKAWRQLLAAWARAFDPDDPVCLVLKTGSYYEGDAAAQARVEAEIERLGPHAPIRVVTGMLPAAELPGLYTAADAYVLASRGEGWGRTQMEALACGLPTVASRWSGTLEFMDDEWSWLVDGELVDVPADDPLFAAHRGHRWFEPDVESLAACLRDIAADWDAARAKAAGARPQLEARFGMDATATTLAEAAREAWQAHGERRRRVPLLALRGDFGSHASLAVVNDELSEALEARGARVVRRPAGAERAPLSCAGVHHAWPPRFDVVTDGPQVAILPWEYGAPPREWLNAARTTLDRVWVPSEHVRRAYVEHGMAPGVVEVVPNGIDPARFSPDGPALELPRRAGTVFLFVGGTIWRKGPDLLADAWRLAFGPDDDVLLVVKDAGTAGAYRGQTQGARFAELAADETCAPVHYLDEELPPDALPALYRAADVAVFPYRGEGFCLPALEALACGVPVIHTSPGPTEEFVPDEAGWRVAGTRRVMPEAVHLPELTAEPSVTEPGLDALVAALRDAADAGARAPRAARAREAALRSTWDAAAAAAERSLARLADEDLPPVRHVRSAGIESRETLVVAAPKDWAGLLDAWVAAVGRDDPVTLGLFCAEGVEVVLPVVQAWMAERGLSEDELPDIALVEPGDASLLGLVMRAHAVLLDPAQAGDPPPVLVRRALRVLTPEADVLRAFVSAGVPARA